MTESRASLLGLLADALIMGAMSLLVQPGMPAADRSPCEDTAADPAPATPIEPSQVRQMAEVALPPPPPMPVEGVTAPPARSVALQQNPPANHPAAMIAPAYEPVVAARALPEGKSAPSPESVPKSAPDDGLAATSSTRAVPAPALLVAGGEEERSGRPLLRLLEHGEGPLIEIAWPGHRVARSKLYDLLARCHGLKTVLLRGQEILMAAAGNTEDAFNSDRHSGFLRAVIGASPKQEQRVLAALQARNGGGATPARLLSREFDARLLGGLDRLVGSDYRNAKRVTARYAVAGATVLVGGLSVDGRLIEGRIEIRPPAGCKGMGS